MHMMSMEDDINERLYNAARDGDDVELKDILSEGADINWKKKSNVSDHIL